MCGVLELLAPTAAASSFRHDGLLRSIVMTDPGLLGAALLTAHNVASGAGACVHALACGVDCPLLPHTPSSTTQKAESGNQAFE